MQKNLGETEVRHRVKQQTTPTTKDNRKSEEDKLMANENVVYKRGTSTRPNGFVSRWPLFLCLALTVLCLMLIYNLYDVISQRDSFEEELNDLRVKFRTCNMNNLECERKYELSKKQKTTDDLRIRQLEQSNNEHSSQNEQVLQQLKQFETKNAEIVQQSDSLREQIKSYEAKNQELTSQFQQISAQLSDADVKATECQKNQDVKDAALSDVKQKLAANEQTLANCQQAFDTQKQALEKTQLDLQTASQQQTNIDRQEKQPQAKTIERSDGWNQLDQHGHPPATAGSAAVENEVHKVNQNADMGATKPSVSLVTTLSPEPLASSLPDSVLPSSPDQKVPAYPDDSVVPSSFPNSMTPSSVEDQPIPINNLRRPMPPAPAPDHGLTATPSDFVTRPPPLVDDGDNEKQLKFDTQKPNSADDDAKSDDDKQLDDNYDDDQKDAKM